jgi:hypothetical protein
MNNDISFDKVGLQNFQLYIIFLSILFMLGITGCVNSNMIVIEVPYKKDSLGVGPNPMGDIVILSKGKSTRSVSDAVIQTLQMRQYALILPNNNYIPENSEWESDIVALEPKAITQYNSKFPNLSIPLNLILGIKYKGRYKIEEHVIRFEVSSILYKKGAFAPYHEYTNIDYAGNYFSENLIIQIKKKLIENG